MHLKNARDGWISQPSTLQPYHHFHGRAVVIFDDHRDDTGVKVGVRALFLEGPDIGRIIEIPESVVSEGSAHAELLRDIERLKNARHT